MKKALIIFAGVFGCFAASALQAQTIDLYSCGALKVAGAKYLLQANVIAPHTCFSVQADNVTLDLNYHTVTYATVVDSSGARHHGVLAEACWDRGIANNPCGGFFSGLTIENGSIIQGRYGNPYSDAIRVGQGSGTNLTIHNVNITVSGPSAKAIFTSYAGGGQRIYNNTIHSFVKSIANRYNMDGVTIRLDGEQGKPAAFINNNTIIGSAQGGIMPSNPGSKIYSNNIQLASYFTTDFCIYAWAPNVEVYQNICDNTQGNSMGRGIQIITTGASVHDNIVKVRELPRNAEYRGCEQGGAYGIQVAIKDGVNAITQNTNVYHNTVTAYAGSCEAYALRATNLQPNTNNLVHDNQFFAVRLPGTSKVAAGVSFATSNGGLLMSNNSFVADSAAIYDYWTSVNNMLWHNNTFEIGHNPDPAGWQLAWFDNAASSAGNRITDPKFTNGGFATMRMNPVGYSGWGAYSEAYIQWTTTIHVEDAYGRSVAGASVVIKDALRTQVFSGLTNASGNVTAVLVQFRQYNTSGSGDVKQFHTPHSISVTAPRSYSSALSAKTMTVTADTTSTVTVRL